MPKREPSYKVILDRATKEFVGSGLTILSIFLVRKLVETQVKKNGRATAQLIEQLNQK
jgi:hypothetical protein